MERSRADAVLEVSGVVTSGGQPMPGAHVELAQRDLDLVDGLLGREWNGLYRALESNCIVADDQGRFHMINDYPHIKYHVIAWADGFAPGIVGPVTHGQTDIQVSLSQGGALRGRIRLPSDMDASGISLRAYRSDSLRDRHCQVGREFRTQADANGDFFFEHLQPGAWLVSVELVSSRVQELGWSEEDGEACRETPFVFAIGEGALTSGDLELSEPRGPCRLRGQLNVEGHRIKEGYAYLLLTGEQMLRTAFGDVDSEERFELTARAPGTYRLVISAGPGHHRYRRVTDLVTLVPGETVWEQNLTLMEWKEEGTRLDHE